MFDCVSNCVVYYYLMALNASYNDTEYNTVHRSLDYSPYKF